MTRSIDTCALFKPVFLHQRETPVERDKTEMLKSWEKACPTDQLKKEALASDAFVRKFIDKSAHTFQNSTSSNAWEWNTETQRVFVMIKGEGKFQFIRVDKQLGMGTYGRVYKVKNIFDGCALALKVARELGEKALKKELNVYKKIYPGMSIGSQHTGIQKNCMQILLKLPNFVFSGQLNSFCIDEDAKGKRCGILMPLYPLGDLARELEIARRFTDLGLYNCIYQILLGQARLQDMNMVHIDLVPQNCFITKHNDDNLEVHLGDMGGISTLFEPDIWRKELCYQKDYEVFTESCKKKDIKTRDDILFKHATMCSGVLIYMLCSHTNRLPYRIKTVIEKRVTAEKQQVTVKKEFADEMNTDLYNVNEKIKWLANMWNPDYKKRPTPKEALLNFHCHITQYPDLYQKYDKEVEMLCTTKDEEHSQDLIFSV